MLPSDVWDESHKICWGGTHQHIELRSGNLDSNIGNSSSLSIRLIIKEFCEGRSHFCVPFGHVIAKLIINNAEGIELEHFIRESHDLAFGFVEVVDERGRGHVGSTEEHALDRTDKLGGRADGSGLTDPGFPDQPDVKVREQGRACGYPDLLLEDRGENRDRCPPPKDLGGFKVICIPDEPFDPAFALAIADAVDLALSIYEAHQDCFRFVRPSYIRPCNRRGLLVVGRVRG